MEAGHGKGVCDRVGGASKRMARNAIMRGTKILNAADYVKWGNCESESVSYRLHTTGDITLSRKKLEVFESESIPGTMKYHACVPIGGTSSIALRSVACFCQGCYRKA